MDPRVQELWAKHQREESVIFRQFRAANPTLQVDVDGAEWTADQEYDYAQMLGPLQAAQKLESEALIAMLKSEQ